MSNPHHTALSTRAIQVSKGTTARQYIDDADSPPTKRKCQERSASAHQTGKQLVSVPQWQRANNKADEPTLTKVPVAGSRGPKDTSAKGTGYKHGVSLTNLGWAPTLCGVGFHTHKSSPRTQARQLQIRSGSRRCVGTFPGAGAQVRENS